MAEWREAVPLDQLPASGGKLVRIDEKKIALFRWEGGIYATDNRCPHEGYPLVEGSIEDGILTCNWHNWKFKLSDGGCIFGGENVRVYPVEVRKGTVFVNVQDPPPSVTIPGRKESLGEAMADMDTGRMARDIVRLIHLGVAPADILLDAARYGAVHAEYGWNHALAVVSECARMAPEFPGEAVVLPLTQACRAVSEENLRQPPRPHPGPESVNRFSDSDHVFRELRDAVEKSRLEKAEGLFRGAVEAGVPPEDLSRWLFTLATDHFLSFGHALIYVTKAFEMSSVLGPEVYREVFPSLIPRIGYSTREDLLPYMRATMKSLNGARDELPGQVRKQGAPPGHAFDEGRFRKVLLDGTPADTFAATYDALSDGIPVDRILDATVLAASERLLRFDPEKDRAVDKDYGWLDVTHNLTYANAARKACRALLNPDTLRGVYFSTWFVNRTRKLDLDPENRMSWSGNPTGEDAFEERLLPALDAHDLEGAARAARAAGAPGNRKLGRILLQQALEDRGAVQIFVTHLIKTVMAATEESKALSGRPDADLPLVAAARFLAADRRERAVNREVHLALDFVVHGRPSETV